MHTHRELIIVHASSVHVWLCETRWAGREEEGEEGKLAGLGFFVGIIGK